MEIIPSQLSKRFYRGNLHGHCVNSDGQLQPEEVIKKYKDLGYDFTCLSDHLWIDHSFASSKITDTTQLNEPDFITIPSAEIHCYGKKYDNDGIWHIVANGLPLDFASADDQETAPQLVQRAKDAGAYVTLAHPEWYSLTFEEAMTVSHAHGVEVYNHSCYFESGRGSGIAVADYLLQENHRINLTATDDSHFRVPDAGGGWVMVAASELSANAIIDSLKAGKYYSSTGVDILQFEQHDRKILIECSPVSHLCLAGSGNLAVYKTGTNITKAEFNLDNFKSDWFRLTLIDDSGHFAWSNPVWL